MYEQATSIKENGFAPSIRDMFALGIKSSSTVHTYLTRLEEKATYRKRVAKLQAHLRPR